MIQNNLEVFSFIKEPYPFKGFRIYPPSYKNVISDLNFPKYERILTFSQEEIEDAYAESNIKIDTLPTPYEFLLANVYKDKEYKEIAEKAFEFFIKEPVTFLIEQKMIMIGDINTEISSIKSINEIRVLKEDDFFDFQNCIRVICGLKQVEPFNPNENPKVKEFKRKQRYRDAVKAKSKNKEGLNTLDFLESICCMGIGITPLNIGEISYTAVLRLFRRYQEKQKYEANYNALLAGAKKKDVDLKFWIRNLND